ncbi:Ran-binding protein 1 domain-containing protein/ RanBP1 domain-containing protein [Monoraphidium neglectum]|uniref:Ran-binding protein 1 domain-containing protein/ RanBP1 domain-containing protein n=1 Tax=Monoraphidium neglectum TaxID=145388 RepID=A0A0D2MWF8_9CHLO|nr:Ran-binding protein 1 domain-containing protein/ RanBP1 domain-containing protein [Monoraphidium neglectum]KIZ06905.1 Ran-binding protein 1 domain-containing protein/ RanBP1 domain-containing protein [Monoraphidium neglectum]|eukprot:XP_013905924.1 Ran-binding protein 1 domain-containing protein/ RanBP1 domain-containing protein [Monoraphidium neglectum]
MSDRPTDHLQPSSKRRPGEQLTKDDADDDEGPGHEPGDWGTSSKADEATLSKRKIIRARRGPVGAAPSPQPEAPPEASAAAGAAPVGGDVAAANPFAGRTLASDNGGSDKALDKVAEAPPAEIESVSNVATDAAPTAAAGPDKAVEASKPAGTSPSGTPSVFGSGSGFGSFAGGGFGGFAGSTGSGFGGFGGSAVAAGGGSLFGFAGTGSVAGGSKPAFGGASGGFGSGAADKGTGTGQGERSEDGGDAKEGGEGEEVFGGPEVAPVVTLEEVPKVTGEESEVMLYTADGALFEFDAEARSWHERGRGEFRINRDPESGAGRAVMRERASKRLILNARLYPTMPTSRMAQPQKGVTFAVVNAAPAPGDTSAAAAAADGRGVAAAGAAADEDKGKLGGSSEGSAGALVTYALRLKTTEAVDSLLAVVESWKARAKAQGGGGGGGAGEDAV